LVLCGSVGAAREWGGMVWVLEAGLAVLVPEGKLRDFAYSSFSSSSVVAGVMVSVASCSPRRIVILVSLPITSSANSLGRS